jgi:hypothetical protein
MATQSTQFPLPIAAPNLPIPPQSITTLYMNELLVVMRLFFTQLAQLVNVLLAEIGFDGSVTFNNSTTANVIFTSKTSGVTYHVALSGNAAGYCWVTNKTANGFTINCSVANTNTTDWVVIS